MVNIGSFIAFRNNLQDSDYDNKRKKLDSVTLEVASSILIMEVSCILGMIYKFRHHHTFRLMRKQHRVHLQWRKSDLWVL